MPKIHSLKFAIALLCFLLFSSVAYAANDGFGASKKTEGKHFIVYYAPQLDPYILLKKLDIGLSNRILLDEPIKKSDSLAAALDMLYNIVLKALDMNLYSLQGNLKICRDRAHLNSVYETIFRRKLNAGSFYINDYNTIYISADDFTKEVLGHEIAHMIISHYFVVPPPQKVAEILSGYVEYQLRKAQ